MKESNTTQKGNGSTKERNTIKLKKEKGINKGHT